MKQKIITIAKGTVMGTAEVIPGVSGSTLALIMGIYDKFVDLLHGVSDIGKNLILFLLRKKNSKEVIQTIKNIDFEFASLLGIGMIIAVSIFSHIFILLIDNYPQYLYAFFFGLIAASTLAPWKRIKNKNIKEILIIVLTTVGFFILFGINSPTQSTNPSKLLLFFGGIISISGMILPGVSGSFLMFLLGLYEYIFSSIKLITKLNIQFDNILNLSIFGVGVIIGFSSFVRVLKIALKKYPSELMAFLIGLMLASLRILWPFMDTTLSDEVENMPKILPTEVGTQEMIILFLIIIITYLITTFIIMKGKNDTPSKI